MGLYVYVIRELTAVQIHRSFWGVYDKGYVGFGKASSKVGILPVKVTVVVLPECRRVLAGAVIAAVCLVLQKGGFAGTVSAVVDRSYVNVAEGSGKMLGYLPGFAIREREGHVYGIRTNNLVGKGAAFAL